MSNEVLGDPGLPHGKGGPEGPPILAVAVAVVWRAAAITSTAELEFARPCVRVVESDGVGIVPVRIVHASRYR